MQSNTCFCISIIYSHNSIIHINNTTYLLYLLYKICFLCLLVCTGYTGGKRIGNWKRTGHLPVRKPLYQASILAHQELTGFHHVLTWYPQYYTFFAKYQRKSFEISSKMLKKMCRTKNIFWKLFFENEKRNICWWFFLEKYLLV